MLTQRQKKLVQLLDRETAPQKVSYFASKLGVSERTLHTEIQELQAKGFQLEKKRGVGIQLVLTGGLDQTDDEQDNQRERRIAIIVELLFEQRKTSFSDLSERYFVSKTSIKQDLDYITTYLLRGTEGRLVSDRLGTRLEFTKVEDRIVAFCRFNQMILDRVQDTKNDLSVDTIDYLSRYYSSDIVQVCKNILFTYIRDHVDTISEIYIQNFLSLLIVQVSLLMAGVSISRKRHIFDKKQHAFYIESAVRILHKASLRLGFEYQNGDIEFLSENLLLYRFEQLSDQLVDPRIVHDLIARVSHALQIDFSQDQQLLRQLETHIPPMLSRLKHSTYVRNPFTEQIKLEFSVIFNVLWLAMVDFGQEIGVTFNEDEIAFLTIYFQLALEKSGKSRKILVVCATGIVTSELLINRIKNSLPSLDKLEIASVLEVEELDLDHYDLVLSTVSLSLKRQHIHQVSPFSSTDELAELLHPPKLAVNLQNASEKGLDPYLKEDLVFFNPPLYSMKEAISFLGQELEKRGFVSSDFQQAMLGREELGNTDLPVGVAIPHGNPQEVQKTFVAIVKCPKKFKWKDYYVDIIFVIGVHPDDMKETKAIVSTIYDVIQSKLLLKQIRQAHSKKEVLKIIYGK